MQKKLKILCLHGHRCSAIIFEHVIRTSWPDTVLGKLDLHFLDAPFPARGKSDFEGLYDPPYYEWFEQKFQIPCEYSNSEFEKSIAYVEDYMMEQGPFDGLLGFSQGAEVATLLVDIQAKGIALAKVPKIKFLILISGGHFEDVKLGQQKLATKDSPMQCPSLHFIGQKDSVKCLGIAILDSFVDPLVTYHPRGHIVPKLDEKSLETTLAFIDKIQKMISRDYCIKSSL